MYLDKMRTEQKNLMDQTKFENFHNSIFLFAKSNDDM